jgi:hypothetical protein
MSDKKVPNGYFENLPDRILNSIYQSDLEQLPETLAQVNRHNPYKVPVGYFDNLPNRLDQSGTTKTRRLWPLIASVAACVVLMIMVSTDQFTQDSDPLSETEIIDYFAENLDDIDGEILYELAMQEDGEEIDDLMFEEILSELSDYELEQINQNF